jgi:uncharacterized protein YvpB
MEKKRFKMYKKGKTWLVAPIVFFGLLGAAVVADNTVVHADEVKSDNTVLMSEPTEPTNPVEPTEPTEPTSPVEPTEPTEPASPVEPTEPTEPASPVEPTEPTEPASPVEPTEPTEPASPVEPTEPTEPTSPVEPIDPKEPTNPTEPTKPIDPTEPEKKEESKTVSTSSKSSSVNTTVKATAKSATSSSKTSAATTKAARISIYRVYNPNSGEHLHTMNINERNYLVKLGWRNEGISMYVDGTGNQLFRLYNPNSGEHFYTLNASERENLKKHGWRYEGVAWRTPTKGQAMYRVFNPNARGAGSHHYTMLLSERNNLIKLGWRNEGIAWYTLGGNQTVASYVLLNAPYINQNAYGFPMGCEAASLLQALQLKGYAKNYNLTSFIKEMPKSSNNNPNNGFSGDPANVVSGVYHSIYAKPLADWGSKYGKTANVSGYSVEQLKDELRNGNPVVVYVTLNFAAPTYGKYWWGTGINNAHIMTLDGFNEANQTYHVSDPNGGKYWVSASKFETSYNLRKSAVVVR